MHVLQPASGLSLPLPVLLAGLVVAGCRPLPTAPIELSDLSVWLFQNFESEDPDLLAVGLGNLRALFDAEGVDEDFQDQAWALTPLADEHVADVTHPDRDLGAALPVGLAFVSSFGPDDQARVMILPDQTPVEPASPDLYARSFREPTDPSCFPPLRCDLLRSDNRVRKQNTLMSIEYEKRKDFRWNDVILDDRREQGILARSWMEEEAWGEEEATAIYQSYSIDVFLPDGQGGSVRYLAMWTEAEMYGAGGDLVVNIMRAGIEDVMEATEDWLVENP